MAADPSGRIEWPAVPGDPVDGDLIARELDTVVRLAADARRVQAEAEADEFMAALLTT